MSGIESPLSSDELRRRFAVWTLAIFSTLSGSGSVQVGSPIWAADPPAGQPPENVPENAPQAATGTTAAARAEPAAETSAENGLTRQSMQDLIAKGDFQQAAQRVRETLAGDPSDEQIYLSYVLINAIAREHQAQTQTLLKQLLEVASTRLNADSSSQLISTFILATQRQSSQLASDQQVDEAIEVLKQAMDRMAVVRKDSPMTSTLPTMLAQLCMEHNRVELAREQLEQQIASAKTIMDASSNPSSRRAWATAVSNFVRLLGDALPEQVEAMGGQAEQHLRRYVESDEAGPEDFQAYQSVQLARVALLDRTDPERSLQLLNMLKERGSKLAERLDTAAAQQLRGTMTTLEAALKRTNSKLVHHRLIGTRAPELPIEAVVNMPHVTMDQLRGKVVLIDFWAVWCGPCIATFPHLRHLHETYAPKGLVIVGLTRQYGYVWDQDAGKQVADKSATLEQELDMLAHFRTKYELPYGFVVTPRDSEIHSQYGVYGIPQAVVIDQEGHIQLIVTGSGSANAQQVEKKIQSLLEAKEPS